MIWRRQPVEGSNGLEGALRLGAWWHSDRFAHQRLDENGLSLADPVSLGTARSLNRNWGLYLIAEQQVYRESAQDPEDTQGLGVFSRIAACPADRNVIEFYSEVGMNYRGLLPGRDEDQSGVAMVYGQISRDVRRLVHENNQFTGNDEPGPDFEMIVEGAYCLSVRPGWTIQPSVQLVLHPGGSKALNDALVVGLRTIIDF